MVLVIMFQKQTIAKVSKKLVVICVSINCVISQVMREETFFFFFVISNCVRFNQPKTKENKKKLPMFIIEYAAFYLISVHFTTIPDALCSSYSVEEYLKQAF